MGIGSLRTGYENFIQKQIFSDIVARWRENIRATTLPKLYWDEDTNRQVAARYEQLSDCFVLIGAKRHMNDLTSEGAIEASIGAVSFFRNGLDQRAYLRLPGHVKTRANLNSKVFANIASTIGANTTDFVSRYNQIDEILLARRNSIAHGEYLDLDAEPCRTLVDDVIQLLRRFKDEIERLSSAKAYKAGAAPCESKR